MGRQSDLCVEEGEVVNMDEWNTTSPIYWKILISDDGLMPVEMQDHDEFGYDEDRWLTPKRFDSKNMAKVFIAEILVAAGKTRLFFEEG